MYQPGPGTVCGPPEHRLQHSRGDAVRITDNQLCRISGSVLGSWHREGYCRPDRGAQMPSKSANVKNEKQYEKLKDKGMSKSRAARIANSPGASSRGGKKSGSGSSSKQGGTAAQKKAAGAKGGKAAAGNK
jgi:hypothetical protein